MRHFKFVTLLIITFLPALLHCQRKAVTGKTKNPKFEKTINKLIDYSVPVITVSELEKNFDKYTLLDAREKEEFEVSHIPGAIHIGYDDFSIDKVNKIDKDKPIVIYCSVGYRSEKVGEKLKTAGFTNVQNLFGSIFEWVNQQKPVVDMQKDTIKKVHAYNWIWGKWVDESKTEKVY
ncbi:MAG: rhodanese-like domain-containing protein [Saprospiraceae bacterium]|nr:rhodanese-like domain-containing protein [Saprospiraceae bacterium]